MKEIRNVKTIQERIERIHFLAIEHFGAVKSVKIKFVDGIYVATLKLPNDLYIDKLVEVNGTPENALRKLKNRLKKIIKRYNNV